jgi:gas vesicle protein
MKRISNFLTGVVIGGIAGVVITILAAPEKGSEWLDEIQKKSQDILVEFNRAAQEYREEMEKDLEKRRNPSN